MAAHCNISLCDSCPDCCETVLSGAEWLEVNVIVLLPLLLALLAPICASRSWCQRDDDDVRKTFVASVRLRDTDRSELARDGEDQRPVDESAIDPPMFCCGAGLLPLVCGISGLMVVVFIMCSAFLVTFYTMLTANHACATGLGECKTISCICGNVLDQQGYVFMFCSLAITSLILVQRFSAMFHRAHARHKLLKGVLIIGSLLLTLTGIFPERYSVNGLISVKNGLGIPYYLHLLGVLGSTSLLLALPFFWFVEHWFANRGGANHVPLPSLFARTACAAGALGFGLAMCQSNPHLTDQTTNFCGYMQSKEECDSWPMLPEGDCASLQACLNGSSSGGDCDSLVQPNFRCSWQESQLDRWTSMLAGRDLIGAPSCVRHTCPLFEYSRSVALEFAVLLTVVCYVSSFALHDVKRLLGQRLEVGSTWPEYGAAEAGRWNAELLSPPPPLPPASHQHAAPSTVETERRRRTR